MTFEFTTDEYRFSHGKEPRGYSAWAFEVDQMAEGPVWAPAMAYRDAKVWIKAHVREAAPTDYAGTIFINVCP